MTEVNENRINAIAWWNSLSNDVKVNLVTFTFPYRNGNPNGLTGREMELIYSDLKSCTIPMYLCNQ